MSQESPVSEGGCCIICEACKEVAIIGGIYPVPLVHPGEPGLGMEPDGKPGASAKEGPVQEN